MVNHQHLVGFSFSSFRTVIPNLMVSSSSLYNLLGTPSAHSLSFMLPSFYPLVCSSTLHSNLLPTVCLINWMLFFTVFLTFASGFAQLPGILFFTCPLVTFCYSPGSLKVYFLTVLCFYSSTLLYPMSPPLL